MDAVQSIVKYSSITQRLLRKTSQGIRDVEVDFETCWGESANYLSERNNLWQAHATEKFKVWFKDQYVKQWQEDPQSTSCPCTKPFWKEHQRSFELFHQLSRTRALYHQSFTSEKISPVLCWQQKRLLSPNKTLRATYPVRTTSLGSSEIWSITPKSRWWFQKVKKGGPIGKNM